MNTKIIFIVAIFLADGTVSYFEESDRERAHQRALREFSERHNATGVSVTHAESITLH